MRFDNHTDTKPVVALNSTAIANNNPVNGNIIDTQGYGSLEFLLMSAARTDGTFTPVIRHGDAADLSDAVDATDDELLGLESGAALNAANGVKNIGYRGNKRYVRLSVAPSGVTSGGTVSAVAILGRAHVI